MHLEMVFVNWRLPFPIGLELRSQLWDAAIETAAEGKKSARFRGDGIEGKIRVKREAACFVGMTGVLFEATVETDRGSGNAMFIISRHTLELAAASNAQWN